MTDRAVPVFTAFESPSVRPNRRSVLSGLGAALTTMLPFASPSAAEPDGLHARALRRGLTYGCAVRESTLRKMPALGEAIRREAGMIVPENDLKWRPTTPERGRSDYAAAERLAAFAKNNGLLFRGHTVVWHQNPPVWAMGELAEPGAADLVFAHIREIMTQFRGRIFEWDVVNEAIQVKDGNPGGLRTWGPYLQGGYDFIADCFRVAQETDPAAKLYYNDFGIEHDTSSQAQKRRALLSLLEELRRRDAPIHGLGIQSHLINWMPFDPAAFRSFIADVAALGLSIRLTEFDVNEQLSRGSIAQRDVFVAERVRLYLDCALDEPAVKGILTWGLSDVDNWLTTFAKRPDGLPQRSMPLDERFERKPMWHAMAACIDNAPLR